MIRIIFTIFLLTFLFTNCNSQIKIKSPIDKFWFWFQNNEKRLRDFEKNPDKALTEVLKNLRVIQEGLAVEFEPPKDNVIFMTISADGDKNLFPLIQEIILKAPKIEGWRFIAFRQRMPKDKLNGMILKSSNHEINPNKMKFYPIISGDTLDIIIYTEKVTEENYNQVAYSGLLLLDNLLGEYDCVTKVRSYDFHNMPSNQNELDDLKPLLDLADYIDEFYKK
jgi:hypothetical protein